MLHAYVGNADPAWDGHYYSALVLFVGFLSQIVMLCKASDERTTGVTICAVAIFAYLVRAHVAFSPLLNVGFLFAWGLRIAVKGVPKPRAGSFVEPHACDAALGKTLWSWFLVAPTTYAVVLDSDRVSIAFPRVGATLCAIGFFFDLLETDQREGKFTRNPYVFSSACVSWGLYTVHPSWYTLPFPLAFCALLTFGPEGYIAEEASRRARAVREPAHAEYTRTVSPLLPIPRAMYARTPRWIKATFLGDFFALHSKPRV
jgi:steroid 5-alpha reductase family enzyme